jgi:branched-chain amino acid transport system substrate-binding protein
LCSFDPERRRRMKKLSALLSVICLTMTVIGFTLPASAAEPIRLGAIFGLTGVMAPIAEESVQALKLAFELFLPKEIGGRPIEVIYEDSSSKPDLAVQKAKKLVERDRVCMIFGPDHAGHTMATTGYLDQEKVPTLTLGTSTGGLMINRKWAWVTGGALPQCSYPVGIYAYEDLRYKTCTVLATDREVGHEFIEYFTMAFEGLGGKVIQQQWFPPGTSQFAPYVAKIEKADFLATWIGDADAIAGFPTIRQMGIKVPIVQVNHGGALLSPKAVKHIGDSVVGAITAGNYVSTLPTSGNVEFVKAYEKRYGVRPGTFAGQGMSSAQLAVAALKRTGGDTTPEKLKEALMQPVDTVMGHIEFTKDRGGINPVHIIRIEPDFSYKVLKSIVTRADIVGEGKEAKLKVSVVR